MFRNYWKIAVRQLGKQKFYSFIKIGGFALGIATCLLITLYIRFELSFDRRIRGGGFPGVGDCTADDGNAGGAGGEGQSGREPPDGRVTRITG